MSKVAVWFRPRMHLIWLSALVLVAGQMPSAARDSAPDHGYEKSSALFVDGRYQDVIDRARQLETADGYALAARARLVWAGYFADPETYEPQIEMALNDAFRAIDLDASHVEGNLQAAAAYGYRARLTRSASDGRASRDHIDIALVKGADNPWVQAGLGSWHGETVIAAGGLLGSLMFGAKRADAIAAFDRAIELDPDNPSIHLTLAKMLIRFNKKRYRDAAIEHLKIGLSLPPKRHLDSFLQSQSRRLLAHAESDDWDAAETLASEQVPFARQ